MSKMKITPVAYDNKSTYRADMISDTVFNTSTPFLIISSQPIPKDTNIYFEFEITDYKENPLFRHLPLYVGIHKEPSSGVFATDFSLGSIYYTRRQDFETYEQYNKSAYSAHYKVPTTKSRVPIKGTIIGVGVNSSRNQITIYSDGKPFYSFRPREFNLNDDGEFYFAIASKVYADIEGNINFGTYPMKYRPEGYWDLNQYYVDRYVMIKDLIGSINYSTGNDDIDYYYGNRRPIGYEFPSRVDINNKYAPLTNPHLRDTYIQPNLGPSQLYDPKNNDAFVIDSEHQNPEDHAFLPYPIPVDQKIYFELQCKEAQLDPGYVGVPLTVGITKVKDTDDYMGKKEIGDKVFSIDLWHKLYQYHYANVKLGTKEVHYPIRTVYNPIPPMQPDIIGVLLDLKNQKISIYTNHKLFMTADLNEFLGYPDDTRTFISTEKDQIYFNHKDEVYHLFIKEATDAFTGNGYVICNFGEPDNPDLRYKTLYDNIDVMTYWYYYNYGIRYLAGGEIPCVITTLPYNINVAKTFSCTVYVKSKYDGNDLEFSPGLNMMYNTYNVVTDSEEKVNVPDLNPFEFYEMIHGHRYTEDPYRYDKDLIIFGNVNLKYKDPLHRFISGRFKFTRNYLGKDGNGQDLLVCKDLNIDKQFPKNMPEINGSFYYNPVVRISMEKYDSQEIVVIYKGQEYRNSFEILYGESVSVEIRSLKNITDIRGASEWYDMRLGTLSFTGGNVYSDTHITATKPVINRWITSIITQNEIYSRCAPFDPVYERDYMIRKKRITIPEGVDRVAVCYNGGWWGRYDRRAFSQMWSCVGSYRDLPTYSDELWNKFIEINGGLEGQTYYNEVLPVPDGRHARYGDVSGLLDIENRKYWWDNGKLKSLSDDVKCPINIVSQPINENLKNWPYQWWRKGTQEFPAFNLVKVTPGKTYLLWAMAGSRDNDNFGWWIYYGPEIANVEPFDNWMIDE